MYFKYKDRNRWNIKVEEIIYHTDQKKAAVAVSISDKENFRAKDNIKDEEDHFIRVKESIYQEAVIIINIYDPNNVASNI